MLLSIADLEHITIGIAVLAAIVLLIFIILCIYFRFVQSFTLNFTYKVV